MSTLAFERRLSHDHKTDIVVEPIATPVLAGTLSLFAYYDTRRADDAIPTRSQIDPLSIPRNLLSYVYMLEPVQDGYDWTYRLIGSSIVERFRIDRTGRSLRSFLPHASAEDLIFRSNQIAATHTPTFFQLFSFNTAMEGFYIETMSLPILDQKSGHIWLFGGTFFGDAISS